MVPAELDRTSYEQKLYLATPADLNYYDRLLNNHDRDTVVRGHFLSCPESNLVKG